MKQRILSLDDYPNMDLADVGQTPNLGYGTVAGVRAHAIVSGASAFLASAILASDLTLEVDDPSRFPAAPFTIQISFELMRVTLKAGSVFTVTRGYSNTTAVDHRSGRTVFEVRDEYVYLVSEEPVKAVSAVFVDAVKQSEGFTAYTGQAGDSHADWPDKAVVAFNVEAFITKQVALTTEEAAAIESGETVSASIGASSSDEVADGSDSSFTVIAPNERPADWVAFSLGVGNIKTQLYSALVENPGITQAILYAVVQDMASGLCVVRRRIAIEAGQKVTFQIAQDGGQWETKFSILPLEETVNVYELSKAVLRDRQPALSDSQVIRVSPVSSLSNDEVADGLDSTVELSQTGRLIAWAGYDDSALGDVESQTHSAVIVNSSLTDDAVLKLISEDLDGTGRKLTKHTVPANTTSTITHEHSGGDWTTITRVLIETAVAGVRSIDKSVTYTTESIQQGSSLEATGSSKVVIGEDITVDVDWSLDDALGTYTGTPLALIERPDHVIKHFIVNRMGGNIADIDNASFDAAGLLYAAAVAGGYKLGFVINERYSPSDFLATMASESRSTASFSRGSWFLSFIPDAAPVAIKTIASTELVGEGSMFRFSKGSITEVKNVLTARYKRRYLPGLNEGAWDSVIEASDATSRAKFGDYPLTVEFKFIRHELTAQDVLANILLQAKEPLLRLSFSLFWEHSDLLVGDTIEISNDLYNGRKFYIQGIDNSSVHEAQITAIEWWT